MAVVKYKITPFKAKEAEGCSLCAMVLVGTPIPSSGYLLSTDPEFIGAGIARYRTNGNKFEFSTKGSAYLFTDTGYPANATSSQYKLLLAEIKEDTHTSGNTAVGSNTVVTTIEDGSIEIVEKPYAENAYTRIIDNLSARDQFAVQALNSIIAKMKEDPVTLSEAAIKFYCQQAYEWAASMMTAAANARGDLVNNDETEVTEKVPISETELENTTDKILNNLIHSLERTDEVEEIEPEEEGEDPTVVYSERVYNPKQDALLKAFLGHTPEDVQDEQLYAKFEDLTKLIKNLQETINSKVYERVLIKDFDTLISKLDTMNTNLDNINSSIQSFTSNLNNRLASMESNIIGAMPSTSGLATSGDVASAESSIIAAMPTCRYTPPSNS